MYIYYLFLNNWYFVFQKDSPQHLLHNVSHQLRGSQFAIWVCHFDFIYKNLTFQ